MPTNNKHSTNMNRLLKKRPSLAEAASSKQLAVSTGLKMKPKRSRFRSLHDIYKETSGQKYSIEVVEQLSKETQDLNNKINSREKNGQESSTNMRQGRNNINGLIVEDKKVQQEQTLSRSGIKLPSKSGQEGEKDNCIGTGFKITTSMSREEVSQTTNQKHDQIGCTSMRKVLATSSELVQRNQATRQSDKLLVPVIANDKMRYEKHHLKKPASGTMKSIPSERMIISEGGNHQSGNILMKRNIKDIAVASSMHRGKEKLMTDTTRALDRDRKSGNEINGIMNDIRTPASGKVASMDKYLNGKTCLTANYVCNGTVATSPAMSGIPTNSNSTMISNDVELTREKDIVILLNSFGSNTIHEKSISIEESTGPSSTGKRKVQRGSWMHDLGLETMKATKAAKTSGLITNTQGLEDMIEMNALLGLNNYSNGFTSSGMISNRPASPKEMDLFSSNVLDTSGVLTPGADNDAPNNINNFSVNTSLSLAPTVPQEMDSLKSFGTHGASGFWPDPPTLPQDMAFGHNMNSMNNDRQQGFVHHQATDTFSVSQNSSLTAINRPQSAIVRNNNNPTPLSSTLTLAPTHRRPDSYDAASSNSQAFRMINSAPFSYNSSVMPPTSSFVSNSSSPGSSSGRMFSLAYWWF